MKTALTERPSQSITKTLCVLALLGIMGAGNVAARPLRSIGVSVSDLGNPYFVQIAKGTEREAHRLVGDDVSVTVVSSAYDLPRQIRQLNQFIDRHVDLIVLTAADAKGIEPTVKKAEAAGIKVLAVDVDADGADVTVTTDNTQAGQIACRYLARQLHGSGSMAIINGPPVSSVIERVAGCKMALAKFPGITLLTDDQNGGGTRQGGLEKMTALMTAHPHLKGVFAINDPTALGAVMAAHQAQRDHIAIVSVDGSPEALPQLALPNSPLRATAAQFPDRIAAKAVDIGYQLLQGKNPRQRTLLIPSQLVTPDNVAQYPGWGQ